MENNDTYSGEKPSVVATGIAAVITTMAAVVGLVGNILVIAAVVRKKNLRTRGNAFIVSLSIVGLLYIVFVLLPGIDTLIQRKWRTGDFVCAFHTYYTLAFSLLSLLHTMCIGLDRVVNVVLFTRAKRIASCRNISIAIALCWMVTLAMMLCYHFFVVSGKMFYLQKALRCIAVYTATSWKISISVYCFIFILPSIVIVASYGTILIFVKKKRKILMSNMGTRLAPSLTMAISITNGENQSTATTNNMNDRVTFAPITLKKELSSLIRTSQPISASVKDSTGNITQADIEQNVEASDDVKSLDGTVNAGFCDEDQPNPRADIPGQTSSDGTNHKSSSSATTITVDFLSPSQGTDCKNPQIVENVISNGATNFSSTSTDHYGGIVSQVNTPKCDNLMIDGSIVTDDTTLAYNQPMGPRSYEHSTNTSVITTNQGDLNQRRGSTWPAVSGRERLSEMANALGRARDRLRPSNKIRNDRDLNRMMLAVFAVVWIGYIPYPLVRYIDVPSINVSSNVYMVVTVTMYIAGCVNPIIYGVMHRRFKAAFVEMLNLGKCQTSNRVGARGREGSISGIDRSTAVPRPT